MLSYQHEYHAGNHADVLKHAVLALVIRALGRKPAPIRVLDAFAGSGVYDLKSAAATRTGEFREGIVRVLQAADPPAALEPWLAAVRAVNTGRDDGVVRRYPGSPAVARHLLRPGDHLELLERHPRAVQALRRQFGRDRRIHIHDRDAFEGLPALLPPPERRGVVLLDPAYERETEYRHVRHLLGRGYERFPGGVWLVWYPLLALAAARRFPEAIANSGLRRIWQAELQVEADDHDGMRGSGLLIVNPPWGIEAELAALGPWLARVLAASGPGRWRSGWLVPE